MSLDNDSFKCGLELGLRAAIVIAEREHASPHCIAAIRTEADKINMFGRVKRAPDEGAADAEYQSWIVGMRSAAEVSSWGMSL